MAGLGEEELASGGTFATSTLLCVLYLTSDISASLCRAPGRNLHLMENQGRDSHGACACPDKCTEPTTALKVRLLSPYLRRSAAQAQRG